MRSFVCVAGLFVVLLAGLELPGLEVAVVRVDGNVRVQAADSSAWWPVQRGMVLQTGDRLECHPANGNAVELRSVGRRTVVVGPGAAVVVGPAGIVLQRGSLVIAAGEGALPMVAGEGSSPVAIDRQLDGGRPWCLGAGVGTVAAEPPTWFVQRGLRQAGSGTGGLVVPGQDGAWQLPVQRIAAEVLIADGLARTELELTFVNATEENLEGRFAFGLPPGAAICDYALSMAGRLVAADVVERHRARDVFEQIAERRPRPRDPGLLEWQTGNTFSNRVYPILPREHKVVALQWCQYLPSDAAGWRYRLPVAPDWLRGLPANGLSVRVRVADLAPEALRCEPEAVEIAADPAGGSLLRWQPAGAVADSFSLTGRADGADGLRLSQTISDGQRYLLARWQPPPGSGDWRQLLGETAPRRWCIVVDRSGSIAGPQRRRQTRLLRALLGCLGPEDRFRLATAADCLQWVDTDWRPGTAAALARAEAQVAAETSLGWTDLPAVLGGLQRAQLPPDCPIIYLGDGRHSAGTDERAAVRRRLTGLVDRPWYCLPTATSSDSDLLGDLASAGGAVLPVATLAEPGASVVHFLHALAAGARPEPSLSTSAGDWLAIAGQPDRPGVERAWVARLPETAALPRVQVTVGDATDEDEDARAIRPASSDNELIPLLWARSRIAQLGDSDEPAQVQECIELSQRFRLLSPHSSLLVLESDDQRRRFGLQEQGATGPTVSDLAGKRTLDDLRAADEDRTTGAHGRAEDFWQLCRQAAVEVQAMQGDWLEPTSLGQGSWRWEPPGQRSGDCGRFALFAPSGGFPGPSFSGSPIAAVQPTWQETFEGPPAPLAVDPAAEPLGDLATEQADSEADQEPMRAWWFPGAHYWDASEARDRLEALSTPLTCLDVVLPFSSLMAEHAWRSDDLVERLLAPEALAPPPPQALTDAADCRALWRGLDGRLQEPPDTAAGWQLVWRDADGVVTERCRFLSFADRWASLRQRPGSGLRAAWSGPDEHGQLGLIAGLFGRRAAGPLRLRHCPIDCWWLPALTSPAGRIMQRLANDGQTILQIDERRWLHDAAGRLLAIQQAGPDGWQWSWRVEAYGPDGWPERLGRRGADGIESGVVTRLDEPEAAWQQLQELLVDRAIVDLDRVDGFHLPIGEGDWQTTLFGRLVGPQRSDHPPSLARATRLLAEALPAGQERGLLLAHLRDEPIELDGSPAPEPWDPAALSRTKLAAVATALGLRPAARQGKELPTGPWQEFLQAGAWVDALEALAEGWQHRPPEQVTAVAEAACEGLQADAQWAELRLATETWLGRRPSPALMALHIEALAMKESPEDDPLAAETAGYLALQQWTQQCLAELRDGRLELAEQAIWQRGFERLGACFPAGLTPPLDAAVGETLRVLGDDQGLSAWLAVLRPLIVQQWRLAPESATAQSFQQACPPLTDLRGIAAWIEVVADLPRSAPNPRLLEQLQTLWQELSHGTLRLGCGQAWISYSGYDLTVINRCVADLPSERRWAELPYLLSPDAATSGLDDLLARRAEDGDPGLWTLLALLGQPEVGATLPPRHQQDRGRLLLGRLQQLLRSERRRFAVPLLAERPLFDTDGARRQHQIRRMVTELRRLWRERQQAQPLPDWLAEQVQVTSAGLGLQMGLRGDDACTALADWLADQDGEEMDPTQAITRWRATATLLHRRRQEDCGAAEGQRLDRLLARIPDRRLIEELRWVDRLGHGDAASIAAWLQARRDHPVWSRTAALHQAATGELAAAEASLRASWPALAPEGWMLAAQLDWLLADPASDIDGWWRHYRGTMRPADGWSERTADFADLLADSWSDETSAVRRRLLRRPRLDWLALVMDLQPEALGDLLPWIPDEVRARCDSDQIVRDIQEGWWIGDYERISGFFDLSELPGHTAFASAELIQPLLPLFNTVPPRSLAGDELPAAFRHAMTRLIALDDRPWQRQQLRHFARRQSELWDASALEGLIDDATVAPDHLVLALEVIDQWRHRDEILVRFLHDQSDPVRDLVRRLSAGPAQRAAAAALPVGRPVHALQHWLFSQPADEADGWLRARVADADTGPAWRRWSIAQLCFLFNARVMASEAASALDPTVLQELLDWAGGDDPKLAKILVDASESLLQRIEKNRHGYRQVDLPRADLRRQLVAGWRPTLIRRALEAVPHGRWALLPRDLHDQPQLLLWADRLATHSPYGRRTWFRRHFNSYDIERSLDDLSFSAATVRTAVYRELADHHGLHDPAARPFIYWLAWEFDQRDLPAERRERATRAFLHCWRRSDPKQFDRSTLLSLAAIITSDTPADMVEAVIADLSDRIPELPTKLTDRLLDWALENERLDAAAALLASHPEPDDASALGARLRLLRRQGANRSVLDRAMTTYSTAILGRDRGADTWVLEDLFQEAWELELYEQAEALQRRRLDLLQRAHSDNWDSQRDRLRNTAESRLRLADCAWRQGDAQRARQWLSGGEKIEAEDWEWLVEQWLDDCWEETPPLHWWQTMLHPALPRSIVSGLCGGMVERVRQQHWQLADRGDGRPLDDTGLADLIFVANALHGRPTWRFHDRFTADPRGTLSLRLALDACGQTTATFDTALLDDRFSAADADWEHRQPRFWLDLLLEPCLQDTDLRLLPDGETRSQELTLAWSLLGLQDQPGWGGTAPPTTEAWSLLLRHFDATQRPVQPAADPADPAFAGLSLPSQRALAGRLLGQYVESAPHTAAAQAALAEQLDAASAGEAALAFRRRAVALEPEDPRWVLQLAGELAMVGHNDELTSLLQAAGRRSYAKRFDPVVDQLRRRWPEFFPSAEAEPVTDE